MEEENEIPKSETNAIKPPKRKGIVNKGKKAAKDALSKAVKAFRNAIRTVFIALPIWAKIALIIILIFIILCACVILVLADDSVTSATHTVQDYVSTLSSSSSSSKFYADTGSVMLLNDSDIKKSADAFFAETEKTNYAIYVLMKENYGSASEPNGSDTAISLKQQRTLYEHMLNAERYNFNSIKWIKYNRSVEEGEPEMQVDTDTRLRYPKDSKGTGLQTFVNQYQPYMQNYIIPYSFYIGIMTDARNNVRFDPKNPDNKLSKNFGYELLKNAYHEVQVNQYNIKSHTKITEDTVYDVMTVTIVDEIEIDDNGARTNISKTVSDPVVTSQCVHATSTPKVLSEYDEWNIRYCLKHAKMFDKYIINEYKYTEYDLNNEADDISIARNVYKDANYEQYEEGTYTIPESSYAFEYDDDNKIKPGKYKATYELQIKKGYVETATYTWKDTVEQLSHEERAYNVDDIKQVADGGTLTSKEQSYYSEHVFDPQKENYLERLNIIDIANAQKDVYKNYIKSGEEFSVNIGFHRSWMQFSFYTLKQGVKDLQKSKVGWKYFYGSSVGAEESTISTSNIATTAPSNLTGVDYSKLPNGKLGWPSPGNTTISSRFGARTGGTHRGIDISMPMGETFVASASGEVVAAVTGCTDNYGKSDALSKDASHFCGGGAGNYVKIKVDGSEMYLLYMHMTTVTVKTGQMVTAGQAIGTCGSTGRSTGPHAHFEVRVGGSSGKYAVDPETLLQMP